MSLTVNSTNGVQGNQPAPSSTPAAGNNDDLFADEIADKKIDEKKSRTTASAAQLAKLEQELKKLEVEKSVKEADKKELEAQRKVIAAQKEKIEAEVKANNRTIEAYTDEIMSYNEEAQNEQEQVAKLRKEYDAKNNEAMKINEKLSAKISQVMADSENNVKTQREKIQNATVEAYQKVQAGEIDESGVAQYVAQKVGNSSLANTSEAAFSEINSLSGQVKKLISDASSILAKIGSKETRINKLKAQVLSGNSAVQEVNAKNVQENKKLSGVNSQLSAIDSEISSVNKEIIKIDNRIVAINTEIKTGKTEEQVATPGTADEVDNANAPAKPATTEVPSPSVNKEKTESDSQITNTYNPFVSVAYDKVSYTSVVEALDAISKRNDSSIETARTQVSADKQAIRKLFQEILK